MNFSDTFIAVCYISAFILAQLGIPQLIESLRNKDSMRELPSDFYPKRRYPSDKLPNDLRDWQPNFLIDQPDGKKIQDFSISQQISPGPQREVVVRTTVGKHRKVKDAS